ncbi:MAG: pilus assembly PilX N-terminal domain-containing protein, partial [Vicinamibacterales bacterium]
MMSRPSLRRFARNDDGVAMVMALLFMLLLSAIGTAMLVLSRSETLSSVNYRMMSQARYGAESGLHKAAHYLMNSYTLPASSGSDPLANFNSTVSPVTYSNQPVVLSAMPGVTANYPLSATQSAFAAAATGSLPVGDASVDYGTSATLLSMRVVTPYASVMPVTIQMWRLTSRGQIDGARDAQVEVSAVIERHVLPTFIYGLFATYAGCGALSFSSGNTVTDSYDSSNITLVSGL